MKFEYRPYLNCRTYFTYIFSERGQEVQRKIQVFGFSFRSSEAARRSHFGLVERKFRQLRRVCCFTVCVRSPSLYALEQGNRTMFSPMRLRYIELV